MKPSWFVLVVSTGATRLVGPFEKKENAEMFFYGSLSHGGQASTNSTLIQAEKP